MGRTNYHGLCFDDIQGKVIALQRFLEAGKFCIDNSVNFFDFIGIVGDRCIVGVHTGCPKKNATDLINLSDEEVHQVHLKYAL